ncbi:hypothetical protein KC345_g2 [Hortaea werneckii]|nr:hypothetical protein KC345_g2 [Hortaea werneckii]
MIGGVVRGLDASREGLLMASLEAFDGEAVALLPLVAGDSGGVETPRLWLQPSSWSLLEVVFSRLVLG